LSARSDLVFVSEFMLTSIGLDFARQADAALVARTWLARGCITPRPASLRCRRLGTDSGITTAVDLRHTSVAAIIYPGQAPATGKPRSGSKGRNRS
jgi:hypothetical protein